MRPYFFAFLLAALPLMAQEEIPHETPEQIQHELDEAETQYKHALEMFNPWYAGPLLTGSAPSLKIR